MGKLARGYLDTCGRLPGTPGYDWTATKACAMGLDEPCGCGVLMSRTEQDQGACNACYHEGMQDIEAQRKEQS